MDACANVQVWCGDTFLAGERELPCWVLISPSFSSQQPLSKRASPAGFDCALG